MIHRNGTVKSSGSNKGFSSRFCADNRVHHETPEEGRRTYRPKRWDYNNKDEVNSPYIVSAVRMHHLDANKTLEKLDGNYTRML